VANGQHFPLGMACGSGRNTIADSLLLFVAGFDWFAPSHRGADTIPRTAAKALARKDFREFVELTVLRKVDYRVFWSEGKPA